MTSALIHGPDVLQIFDGAVPSPLQLAPGLQVHGAAEGWIGGDFAIVPATYDTPPANSVETGRSYAIVNGAVQITRIWGPMPVRVPMQCTKTQGILALGKSGLGTTKAAVLAAIDAAIAKIPDPALQFEAEVRVDADNWDFANPLTVQLATALGFDTQEKRDALTILASQQ